MNGISAIWMVLWMVTGTALGAPTLPLEISGDQLTPEFREAATRNRNFVLHVRQGIMELMELYVSENPFMYVDQMSLLEQSLNFSPIFIRSCTQTNFQMETCLINSRNVLQKYQTYLTTDVVERHLQNHPLIIKGVQMNVNTVISNIENLLLLLDINPVATRIEPPRLNFENDFMENVFVYSLLRRLKLLMENTSRVFNYISS